MAAEGAAVVGHGDGMPDLWVSVPVRLGADVTPCEGVLKASQMTFSSHTHGIEREREREERENDKRKKKLWVQGLFVVVS